MYDHCYYEITIHVSPALPRSIIEKLDWTWKATVSIMKESRRDQEDREVIQACYKRLQESGLGEDRIVKKLNKLFTRQKVAIVLKGPKGLLLARFLYVYALVDFGFL